MLIRETIEASVSYDPDTGEFTNHKGQRATYPSGHGYQRVRINGKYHYAHRLAWFIMTGEQPKVVDHVNGNSSDNRWCNLRNGTQAQNCANAGVSKNNKSGFKGVSAHNGKYRATLMHQRKQISLGSYDTPEAASLAYQAAAKVIWGEFARS